MLVRSIATVLMLWSSTAWAATLSWTANSDSDLAGYHVYRCTQLPCTRTSGTASSLATLGTSTSFNIGTPAVTEYYFVTAYDFANNESAGSGIATFTPVGSTPPAAPPAIGASPMSLSFTSTQGGADPATQSISVSNLGGGTPTWGVSNDAAWMWHAPNTERWKPACSPSGSRPAPLPPVPTRTSQNLAPGGQLQSPCR